MIQRVEIKKCIKGKLENSAFDIGYYLQFTVCKNKLRVEVKDVF